MGRHSMDYRPEDDTAVAAPHHPDHLAAAEGSIAPPGGPIDPGVPGAPDVPGTPPATPSTPSEPAPLAPDDPDDGATPRPGNWHAAGDEVL